MRYITFLEEICFFQSLLSVRLSRAGIVLQDHRLLFRYKTGKSEQVPDMSSNNKRTGAQNRVQDTLSQYAPREYAAVWIAGVGLYMTNAET